MCKLTHFASELGKLGSKEKEQNWNKIAFSNMCYKVFYETIRFKFYYFVESLPVRVIWHARVQLNLPLVVGAASTFRKHRFDFTSFCPIFAHSISTNHSRNPNSAKLTHHTFLWRSEWHSPGMGSHNRPRNSFDSDRWWRRKTFSYRRKVWCYFSALFPFWKFEYWMIWHDIAIWLYGDDTMERRPSLRAWYFMTLTIYTDYIFCFSFRFSYLTFQGWAPFLVLDLQFHCH